MQLRARSLADTHAIAVAVAGLARAGDMIVLAGEMGAGKTAFAQGFGRALGVTDTITSPTFTLVHSYPTAGGRLTLHHADLYRLDTTADVAELALNELAEFDGIVLVEWGDVAATMLGDHLAIRLAHTDDDIAGGATADDDRDDRDDLDQFTSSARLVSIDAVGPGWAARWDRLRDALQDVRAC